MPDDDDIHTPIWVHPGGFTDLVAVYDTYLTALENEHPAFANAARALRYLRDPANSQEIAKRERRRMQVCLPPLRATIEAEYRRAYAAVIQAEQDEDPIPPHQSLQFYF